VARPAGAGNTPLPATRPPGTSVKPVQPPTAARAVPPAKPPSGVSPAAAAPGKVPSGRRAPGKDREALGLSALKPSEIIEGLEEAAKRAEHSEAREEARRKSGGGMNLTTALHVDDTGKRWSRNVMLLIFGSVAAISALIGGMIYFGNRTVQDPRDLSLQSRNMLSSYVIYAQKIKAFKPDETITADAVKDRIKELLDGEIKSLTSEIDREIAKRKALYEKDKNSAINGPKVTGGLIKDRETRERLASFKDALRQPFVFTIPDGETLQMTAPTIPKTEPIDPVTVRLKAKK